jgi:exopolysaccharide production protein ExoQ
MPPALALCLTLGFIVFLFRRESKEKTNVSVALWIPLAWFLITGSRFFSQWLVILGVPLGDSTMEDGSPIDALVFLALIVGGFRVLGRRRVTLAEFARNNHWLTIFLLYCFIAILWSDFPLVAFKRWIKILGHPIMALIVLTDPNPQEAVRRLFKRSAYVLIPLSILFIKYYPDIGRGFDPFAGIGYNRGVTTNKNELGYDCMIFGLFFFWNTLLALRIENRKSKINELLLSVGFLAMVLWLLRISSSATSLSCIVIGSFTILALGLKFVNKRFIGVYLVVGILAFAVAEPIFGIYTGVLNILGRDATLTDRTEVWHDALRLQPDPIFGAGFESFWLGDRLDKLWAKWWWRPTQAHNGYIETYLNLGFVGIALLAGLMLGTFRKISLDLLRRFQFARFRLGFLFAILIYNFTEATFKGVHIVWTVFYLIAIDYPAVRKPRSEKRPAAASLKSKLSEPLPVANVDRANLDCGS